MFRINKRNGKGIIPMTRIMLYWGYDADIVECPEFIAEKSGALSEGIRCMDV